MNQKRECTWLQPPPVILSLPCLAQGCAIVCVMWDNFSRKAWETCASTHMSPGETELSQSGAALVSHPRSKRVSPPTDQLGSVVLRICALGIASTPDRYRPRQGLWPSSLCLSDRLQCAGPWGVFSPHCLLLHQQMGH